MRKSLFFLLLSLCSLTLFAQQKIVSGKITDQTTGQPIQGVNVSIKGTTTTVVTDAAGAFSIPAPSPQSVLVISYVGFGTQEITVGNQETISISMSNTLKGMDEVVVIGYGTVKRRDLTGSVSTLKGSEITQTPTFNAVEAMQGRVPGVDVTRSSGAAGAGSNIRVRGNRSISGNNDPLYIIDGFQGGNPADLNAYDIESIEVLKDASATAIYGSRGANGVILITTKKGLSGKTTVSYDGFYGVNGFTEFPKTRLGDEYIQLRREAYRNSLIGGVPEWQTPADDPKLFPNAAEYAAVQQGQWVDWYDLVNRNGTQQSHTVSIRGGSEKTRLYLSTGYYKEEGMLTRNDYTRYNLRLNADQTLAKWAKAGVQSQVAYFNQNSRQDPLSVILSTTPFGIPYDSSGRVNLYPVAGSVSTLSPITDERGDTVASNNTIRTNLLANAYLELTPVKGLSFRSSFGVNLNFSRQGTYNSATSLAQRNTRNIVASQATAFFRSLTWDNVLTYSTQFRDDHSLTITGVQSYLQNDLDNFSATGMSQLLGSQLYYNLGATAGTTRGLTSGFVGSNLLSFAGRINYSYKGKYLLSVTERADGASRLSPGNKWDYFPSVAVGWNLSDEKFMENVRWIDNLKIRGSWGITGNYGIAEYGTQSGIFPAQNIGFGDIQATMYQFNARIGNPDLKWEKSYSTNLGFDMSFLSNRFNATVELYRTVTKDIILERSLPRSTGVSTVYQNVGETVNKGIELALTSQNIRNRDFRWTTIATFTRNNEEITKLVDSLKVILGPSPENSSLLLGHPIQSFYSYRKLGIWQLDKSDLAARYRFGTTPFKPGDIWVEDFNGDSLIDTKDRQFLGSAVPKFVLGLQNNFSYKGLDLGIYMFFRYGQMINAEFLGRYNPSGEGSGPASFDYWTPENPTNDFPRPRKGAQLINYAAYQSLNYIDGSYFKLKTVTLGYTFPKKMASKVFASNIRIYATGNNLFTKAKSHFLDEYDPERGGAESSPLSRQVVVGVNLDF
jgi:TonB-linked SusC/RagA family outer membrane protein